MLINLTDYERRASEVMEPSAWGYYAGGANDEITVRENVKAWQRYAVRYRTMVDVSTRSLQTTVLGTPIAFPVLVAPTAMQRLAHPEGECAMALGVHDAESLMIVSTTATTRLEDVMAASQGPKWFQVYVYAERGYTEDLVRSAAAVGYSALVLTVDAPMIGQRERDVRLQFSLPPGMEIPNARRSGRTAVAASGDRRSGLEHHFRGLHDSALTPRDIHWLREISGLPVVVKGIVRGDDARRALEAGAAGIVVSNHGGRQLDTAVSTAHALEEVVTAVAGGCEVYVDGGIRRGVDVLKALALGARAVLLGRPPLWGLAVGGREGVADVLGLVKKELDVAMALSGCRTIQEITRDLVVEGVLGG